MSIVFVYFPLLFLYLCQCQYSRKILLFLPISSQYFCNKINDNLKGYYYKSVRSSLLEPAQVVSNEVETVTTWTLDDYHTIVIGLFGELPSASLVTYSACVRYLESAWDVT